MTNFSWIDWTIVGVYLLGSTLIGVAVTRFVRSMKDFVVAGRSIDSALGIATMVGSELGLITIVYAAQKGFTGGFASFHIAVLAGVVTLLVGWTGYIVVPLRRMGVLTIPEFYERRFSRGVRIYGGSILAVSGILNMGLFLSAGAGFVANLTGFSEEGDALKIIMTALLVLVLAYTMLGGMVSIVITDYIQFVVLSFGLLLTAAFALLKLGWTNIVDTVATHFSNPQTDPEGIGAFDPIQSEAFGPSYVVWMAFLGLVSCGIWQTAVLRACSAKDTRSVRRIYTWSSLGFLVRFLIPNFLGICALVFVLQEAELKPQFFPADGGEATKSSLDALPIFLGQLLPTGLLGLVLAGMLAAFMSTHDSYLLCWSSVLTQDVVAPLGGDTMSTKSRVVWTRVFIFAIGVFLLIWGLWYKASSDLWDYMAVTGAIYFTGAFALLGVGLYWSRASTVGAYLALTSGLFATLGIKNFRLWIAEQGWFDLTHYSEAEIGLTVIGLSVTFLVLGSLLFPDRATRDPSIETATP